MILSESSPEPIRPPAMSPLTDPLANVESMRIAAGAVAGSIRSGDTVVTISDPIATPLRPPAIDIELSFSATVSATASLSIPVSITILFLASLTTFPVACELASVTFPSMTPVAPPEMLSPMPGPIFVLRTSPVAYELFITRP